MAKILEMVSEPWTLERYQGGRCKEKHSVSQKGMVGREEGEVRWGRSRPRKAYSSWRTTG